MFPWFLCHLCRTGGNLQAVAETGAPLPKRKEMTMELVELLVGGLEHEIYVPFHIWDVILPIDELIFFKMVKTTNQIWVNDYPMIIQLLSHSI